MKTRIKIIFKFIQIYYFLMIKEKSDFQGYYLHPFDRFDWLKSCHVKGKEIVYRPTNKVIYRKGSIRQILDRLHGSHESFTQFFLNNIIFNQSTNGKKRD